MPEPRAAATMGRRAGQHPEHRGDRWRRARGPWTPGTARRIMHATRRTAEAEPGSARLLARLSLVCVAGAVAAVVAGAGKSLILLLGLVGLGVAGAGVWWALAHRGIARF